jgi:hypothetical protein
MIAIIKQKQLRLSISIVQTITYLQGSCMITIGKIPRMTDVNYKFSLTTIISTVLW